MVILVVVSDTMLLLLPRHNADVTCMKISIRLLFNFRVLSKQYVERSAYANVLKFNRERKRFERAKETPDVSTGFWPPCWSPSEGLQHGVSIFNTIIFSDSICE